MAHRFFGSRFDNIGAVLLLASAVAGCATAPKLPPAPTTAEIVQMAKDGQAAEAIIQRMQQSWGRSEERRVGKECPYVCRSRWSPYH